jgi:hypothetical protein
MVRVHLTENSDIRASTADFRRRRALARTGKPVNEQDPWTLYHCSHKSYHFMGPSGVIGYAATAPGMPPNKDPLASLVVLRRRTSR